MRKEKYDFHNLLQILWQATKEEVAKAIETTPSLNSFASTTKEESSSTVADPCIVPVQRLPGKLRVDDS